MSPRAAVRAQRGGKFNLKRAVELSTLFGFWQGSVFLIRRFRRCRRFLGHGYGNSRKERIERKGFWRIGFFNTEVQRCGTGILPVMAA